MSPISQKPLYMDREHFDQLVKAVRQMDRHMSGKVTPGAKTTEVASDPKSAIEALNA